MTVVGPMTRLAAVLLIGVLALGGCGGDGESDDVRATAPTTPTESAEPEPADDETEKPERAGGGDFCGNVEAVAQNLSEFGDAWLGADQKAMVAWAKEFPGLGRAMVESAPAEHAKEAETSVEQLIGFAETMARIDYTDEEAVRSAMMDIPTDPRVEKSANRLMTSCGLDPESF